MLRSILALVVALGIGGAAALAADGDKKPAGKPTTGTFKSLDAQKGALVISVGGDGGAQDKTFQLNGVKIMNGKEEAQPKAGDRITVTTDATGKVLSAQVAGAKKEKK